MNIVIIRVPDTQKYEKLGYEVIRIDRKTPVGNPFYMRDESQRDSVCDAYEAYFHSKVTEKKDQQFLDYLRMIYKLALQKPVALACWCAPKRCHGETIKKFIEAQMKKEVK